MGSKMTFRLRFNILIHMMKGSKMTVDKISILYDFW